MYKAIISAQMIDVKIKVFFKPYDYYIASKMVALHHSDGKIILLNERLQPNVKQHF